MKGLSVIIVFSSLIACFCQAKELPSFVKKCKLKSSDLDDCMKKAVQDFTKYLREGVKSMKIPSLDPYVVPEVKFKLSWMNSTFTNFEIHNTYNLIADNIHVDFDGGVIEMLISMNSLKVKTHYVLDGKLTQLVLHGDGQLDATVKDLTAKATLLGKKVKKTDGEYFVIEDWKMQLLKRTLDYIHFSNLVDGNSELTDRLNTVIMDNREELFNEIFPIFEEVMGKILFTIAKDVFNLFPLGKLFD